MSKGDGSKIAIKFDKLLVGDVTGLLPVPLDYIVSSADLALNKPATANNEALGVVSRALDGSVSTCWGANVFPCWMIVDLGSVIRVSSFYIDQNNSGSRGREYTLYGSNDNINWTAIISGTLVATDMQTINCPESDYRYLKMEFTSYWSNPEVRVYIFKVIGKLPVGNERAFAISGQEEMYVGSDLVNKSYAVNSVSAHPTEPNSILLSMKDLFRNSKAALTVSYTKELGTLQGLGGRIESFVESFLPVELFPYVNPIFIEHLTSGLSGNFELIAIEFIANPVIPEENLILSISATIEFWEAGNAPI